MSEKNERKQEKAIAFKEMAELIENCHELSKLHHLKQVEIPNIIITYNNKILLLAHEFKKIGINFYDVTQCESSSIIDFQLLSIITAATHYIESYVSSLSVSKEQTDEYVASYKKPSLFKRIFKGATYAPKKSFITDQRKQDAMSFMKKYKTCNDAIYNFRLTDMATAISFYRKYAASNGVSDKDLDARVEKIHAELSLLGCDF